MTESSPQGCPPPPPTYRRGAKLGDRVVLCTLDPQATLAGMPVAVWMRIGDRLTGPVDPELVELQAGFDKVQMRQVEECARRWSQFLRDNFDLQLGEGGDVGIETVDDRIRFAVVRATLVPFP